MKKKNLFVFCVLFVFVVLFVVYVVGCGKLCSVFDQVYCMSMQFLQFDCDFNDEYGWLCK